MLLVCGGISLPPYEVQRYKKLEITHSINNITVIFLKLSHKILHACLKVWIVCVTLQLIFYAIGEIQDY